MAHHRCLRAHSTICGWHVEQLVDLFGLLFANKKHPKLAHTHLLGDVVRGWLGGPKDVKTNSHVGSVAPNMGCACMRDNLGSEVEVPAPMAFSHLQVHPYLWLG